jgi:hypothetical protein
MSNSVTPDSRNLKRLVSHSFTPRLLALAASFLATALLFASAAHAQVSAAISGRVTDPAGATVSGADVTVTNLETGETRKTVTDDGGRYSVPTLALGEYEVQVARQSFREEVRGGIHLVVGQEATVDFALSLGQLTDQIKVNADAPMVSVAAADISGIVGEQQVKDLPLNGRSYDELMTLNPGVVNFTWEKTGALVGVSNSTTANMFSVSGNRPQQNLFLLNGVEFTGAAENNMTPGGASGQLLGVDAVREFNILRDSDGAEYGKKPGGQVVIVTQSGTNSWHGSAYEFLRNNALDAPNYFDPGSAPPFRRNQFGGSLGGPAQKDKTFFFANYEGFRQSLNQTSVAIIPDCNSYKEAPLLNPTVGSLGLMNLWPQAPCPGSPQYVAANDSINGPPSNYFTDSKGVNDGIYNYYSTPLSSIREDFGTVRVDHVFSARDTASVIYTADDSGSTTGTPLNPYSSDIVDLREQVLSFQETHVFSPTLLNTARFGFSRAGYYFTGEPTPNTPAASVAPFLSGVPSVGAVVVGGSQASNSPTQLGLAGSNNGSNLHMARNLFTYTDQVTLIKGRHQITAGAWFQRLQSNEEIALSQYGQLTFNGLPALLYGTASFLYDPTPTPESWRSLYAAFFVQDAIRVLPSLTLTLGFRGESTTGWNEAYGNAANYALSSGIPQCATLNGNQCYPVTGTSFLSTNKAAILPEPRFGVAWSPFGSRTVIRGGFGMYHDLQDALGYRADQNAPYNPSYTIAVPAASTTPAVCCNVGATTLSDDINFPISRAPASGMFEGTLVPGGVQPDMRTPTVLNWSLRVERELSPNMSLSVGYVGSHGYHELIGVDLNAPQPVPCAGAQCNTTLYTISSAGTVTSAPITLPTGTPYIALTSAGAAPAKPNTHLANTWTWMSEGDSSYNALQVDFKKRFSQGLTLRGIYTWSKVLDDGDSYNQTAAGNAPGLVANPYDIAADWGLGTYDVRNVGVVTADYDLPIGHGKRWLSGGNGVGGTLATGWRVNSIVTLQSGFPFTPQIGYNSSNDGDTRNPVRPFLNPNFTGPVVVGTPSEWFNPAAIAAVPSNSGFFGNLGRDPFIGPGLATWDFSVVKDTHIRESLNLQFRAEIFNMLDRANFNTPNLITWVQGFNTTGAKAGDVVATPTPSGLNGSITSTSTASRQVQFGLKLVW